MNILPGLHLWFVYLTIAICSISLSMGAPEPADAQNRNKQKSVKAKKQRPVQAKKVVQKKSDEGTENENVAAVGNETRVTAVRFLSSSDYTRVMMDLSQEARFEVRQLKEDTEKGLPPRIYIDIMDAKLALASKAPITVDDGLLRQVRLGQYTADTVRVVLDMNSLREHKTFLLPDPYRLVIDIQGQGNKAPAMQKNNKNAGPKSSNRRAEKTAQAPNVAPGIRKIVLDPGHGGKDPGAIGVGGLAEKDIVLAVAKKLAAKLESQGINVVLTRKDDRYVPLEDRTAIANAENADLFISLHVNASPNAEARGLETYYLDNTTDEAARRLAARENGTSQKYISDLQFILSDMTQNMKLEDSISLAHRLQGSMVGHMNKVVAEIRDLGVKKALFYVLVGARMPSVLVEMFFITNRTEGSALAKQEVQDTMVEALMDGIKQYGRTTLAAKTL